jgi:hypothetical protein
MSRELQKILAFYSCLCYYLKVAFGRSDGMADVTDSKYAVQADLRAFFFSFIHTCLSPPCRIGVPPA